MRQATAHENRCRLCCRLSVPQLKAHRNLTRTISFFMDTDHSAVQTRVVALSLK